MKREGGQEKGSAGETEERLVSEEQTRNCGGCPLNTQFWERPGLQKRRLAAWSPAFGLALRASTGEPESPSTDLGSHLVREPRVMISIRAWPGHWGEERDWQKEVRGTKIRSCHPNLGIPE